jgi:hypothetical protein
MNGNLNTVEPLCTSKLLNFFVIINKLHTLSLSLNKNYAHASITFSLPVIYVGSEQENHYFFKTGGTCDWFCCTLLQSCGGRLPLPIRPHHTDSENPGREKKIL